MNDVWQHTLNMGRVVVVVELVLDPFDSVLVVLDPPGRVVVDSTGRLVVVVLTEESPGQEDARGAFFSTSFLPFTKPPTPSKLKQYWCVPKLRSSAIGRGSLLRESGNSVPRTSMRMRFSGVMVIRVPGPENR
jgi:hypothetical protein